MVIVVDANLKVNFSRSLTFCSITANPNYCGTTCTHISKVKSIPRKMPGDAASGLV